MTGAGAAPAPRCPLCGRTDPRPWKAADVGGLDPDDLAITDRRYGTTLALYTCRCGFRFADVGALDLTTLYGALEDPAYEEGADTRAAQQAALLRRVRRAAPDARSLLDVGAANGLLVEAAAAAGLTAAGVEPSAALAAAAVARGLDVHCGVLPHPGLGDRRFDVVTCVDVVEHVADPVGLLGACRDACAPGGRLLVVTPDAASVAARLLGPRWWHLRLAHVGYFDRSTLHDALRRAGFVPEVWWRPGWVFEVGYLAERVGSYAAPVGRFAAARRDARWARVPVPLNLGDSLGVLARCES